MTAEEIYNECAKLHSIYSDERLDFNGEWLSWRGTLFKVNLLQLSMIPESPEWCASGVCRCIRQRMFNDESWMAGHG